MYHGQTLKTLDMIKNETFRRGCIDSFERYFTELFDNFNSVENLTDTDNKSDLEEEPPKESNVDKNTNSAKIQIRQKQSLNEN